MRLGGCDDGGSRSCIIVKYYYYSLEYYLCCNCAEMDLSLAATDRTKMNECENESPCSAGRWRVHSGYHT